MKILSIIFVCLVLVVGVLIASQVKSKNDSEPFDVSALLSTQPWLENAKVIQIGDFEITYSDEHKGSILISFPGKKSPWAIIESNEKRIKYLIADDSDKSVQVYANPNDNHFQRIEMSGFDATGFGLIDNNLDGYPDMKVNAETQEIKVRLEQEWFPLIKKDGRLFILKSGEQKEIIAQADRTFQLKK